MHDLDKTGPGYTNKHGQQMIRDTGRPGTDRLQRVGQLGCWTSDGANDSEIYLRRCPPSGRCRRNSL